MIWRRKYFHTWSHYTFHCISTNIRSWFAFKTCLNYWCTIMFVFKTCQFTEWIWQSHKNAKIWFQFQFSLNLVFYKILSLTKSILDMQDDILSFQNMVHVITKFLIDNQQNLSRNLGWLYRTVIWLNLNPKNKLFYPIFCLKKNRHIKNTWRED